VGAGGRRASGLAAIIGGLLAIALTPPAAVASFASYGWDEARPAWLDALRPRLGPLLGFAAPVEVYTTYGRLFAPAYLLLLLGLVGLHRARGRAAGRPGRWGAGALAAGLALAIVGVIGDYWGDGAGYPLTLLGLATLLAGSTVYGGALVRGRCAPAWAAWPLVVAGPAGFLLTFTLVPHIPSGATLLFAAACVALGAALAAPARAA
jgi:hypothetical protein